MRDIIENFEDAAESSYDRMTKGLPPFKYKCGCGRIVDERVELNFVSPNPWAMPVCNECLDEYLGDRK